MSSYKDFKEKALSNPDVKAEYDALQPEYDLIQAILKNTTDKNQDKVDWTKAWSGKYPVLKTYQDEVDIPKYAAKLRLMLEELKKEYGYSDQDAMLVLKDILYHEYTDNKR